MCGGLASHVPKVKWDSLWCHLFGRRLRRDYCSKAWPWIRWEQILRTPRITARSPLEGKDGKGKWSPLRLPQLSLVSVSSVFLYPVSVRLLHITSRVPDRDGPIGQACPCRDRDGGAVRAAVRPCPSEASASACTKTATASLYCDVHVESTGSRKVARGSQTPANANPAVAAGKWRETVVWTPAVVSCARCAHRLPGVFVSRSRVEPSAAERTRAEARQHQLSELSDRVRGMCWRTRQSSWRQATAKVPQYRLFCRRTAALVCQCPGTPVPFSCAVQTCG